MSRLIQQVDPFSLPPILDDAPVAALRAMFMAAEKRRSHNRKMLSLYLFLAITTIAGFVVRYYR